MSVGIVLLAAGESSRMGRSKQLLEIEGKSLLTRTFETAMSLDPAKMVVVLGANELEHRKVLDSLISKSPNRQVTQWHADIVVNEQWKTGMGSSLKEGLAHLLSKEPAISSLLAVVCDQPLLTELHLKRILSEHLQSGKAIVASGYSGTAGVPALFDKTLFSEILVMKDDHGAKQIIQKQPDRTVVVDFPEGAIDLDTPEDYIKFIHEIGNGNQYR